MTAEELAHYRSLENLIAVLQAAQAGKPVQTYCPVDQEWYTDDDPNFNFEDDIYRVKPDRQPQQGEPIAVFGNVANTWTIAIFERMTPNNKAVATLITPEAGLLVDGFVFEEWKFITPELEQ